MIYSPEKLLMESMLLKGDLLGRRAAGITVALIY
jgi:hypothetical protein